MLNLRRWAIASAARDISVARETSSRFLSRDVSHRASIQPVLKRLWLWLLFPYLPEGQGRLRDSTDFDELSRIELVEVRRLRFAGGLCPRVPPRLNASGPPAGRRTDFRGRKRSGVRRRRSAVWPRLDCLRRAQAGEARRSPPWRSGRVSALPYPPRWRVEYTNG
jgi:hypothetical protein